MALPRASQVVRQSIIIHLALTLFHLPVTRTERDITCAQQARSRILTRELDSRFGMLRTATPFVMLCQRKKCGNLLTWRFGTSFQVGCRRGLYWEISAMHIMAFVSNSTDSLRQVNNTCGFVKAALQSRAWTRLIRKEKTFRRSLEI